MIVTCKRCGYGNEVTMLCNRCRKIMRYVGEHIIGPLENEPEVPNQVSIYRCDECNIEVEI